MGKTHKEQEEKQALSKNNGKAIRYRKRLQEEIESKEELKIEKQRLLNLDEFERTREDY